LVWRRRRAPVREGVLPQLNDLQFRAGFTPSPRHSCATPVPNANRPFSHPVDPRQRRSDMRRRPPARTARAVDS
jgi:hypothetical protein